MKNLVDVISEGFYNNVGTDIIPQLSRMFGAEGISEWCNSNGITRLKYALEKLKYINDHLSVGDVLVIDAKSGNGLDTFTYYLKKIRDNEFVNKVIYPCAGQSRYGKVTRGVAAMMNCLEKVKSTFYEFGEDEMRPEVKTTIRIEHERK